MGVWGGGGRDRGVEWVGVGDISFSIKVFNVYVCGGREGLLLVAFVISILIFF